jgi:hypothetical protein
MAKSAFAPVLRDEALVVAERAILLDREVTTMVGIFIIEYQYFA